MAETKFIIGDCVVRPDRRLIERGSDVVRVKPKAMAILERLVLADGAVVPREDLFQAAWPGGVVSDETLTQCVAELRRALGDSARDSRVIETIPKQGFRLVAKARRSAGPSASGAVSIHTEPPAERPRLSGKSIFGAAAALTLVVLALLVVLNPDTRDDSMIPGVEPSLAVLPFADMSPGGTQSWFADGLAEELIARLSRLDGLLVAGRTSSFQFKDRNEDLRSIGRQLGVDHVLEGSVRKSGDQIRITAQLIDVSDGFHRWADTYDRPLADIFAVQDDIAQNVADVLSIALSVGELGSIEGGTSDVEAFEAYLRANALSKQVTPDSLLDAIEHYQRAVTRDSSFAIAWAELSKAYRTIRLVLGEEEGARYRSEIQSAIGQALRLAPDSPYVLETAALHHIDRREWLDADRLLQHAADTHPSPTIRDLEIELLLAAGHAGDAIRLLERAIRREPLGAGNSHFLGHAYAMQGRLADALEELERGWGLECCKTYLALEGLAIALATKDPRNIDLWLDRAVLHEQPGAFGAVGRFAELSGDRDGALDWLRDGFRQSTVPDYFTIVFASHLGDYELALDALARFPDPWTFWMPVTKPLRTRAEFRQVLRDSGLVDYFQQAGWNDICRPLGQGEFDCGQSREPAG